MLLAHFVLICIHICKSKSEESILENYYEKCPYSAAEFSVISEQWSSNGDVGYGDAPLTEASCWIKANLFFIRLIIIWIEMNGVWFFHTRIYLSPASQASSTLPHHVLHLWASDKPRFRLGHQPFFAFIFICSHLAPLAYSRLRGTMAWQGN